MKIYRCPNGCSVSDSNKRCSRCGKWMLYDGEHKNMEEIEKKSKEISLGSLPSNIHTPKDVKEVLK